jgi:membrane protease YdiL (CAAX protease family)
LHYGLAEEAPVGGAIALGLLHFACFALSGACIGKFVKLTLSAYRASRLSWLSAFPSIAGILLLQLSSTSWLQRRPPIFGDALGRALIGSDPWRVNAALLALLALLVVGFVQLERGHELSEPVRADATASALSAGVDMIKLERLLTRREPGGSFQVPFATVFLLAVVGFQCWASRERSTMSGFFWNFTAVMILQMVSTLGMQRANRSVARDLLARPLLGALPTTPGDTLAAKAATARRALLTVAAPLVLLLAAGYQHPAWLPELSWRVAASLAAVATYASAATYVAFLTTGLGSVRPRSGVLGSLESFLVAVPFASVLFAPSPAGAALSLLTLAALTFEARRAALRTIDWLDDAELDHTTEVWKALVVFGGFQGAQLLTQQLAAALSGLLSPTAQLLGAYAVAAVALFAMTARSQEAGLPTHRARLAPLGLVAGALSGAFAWLYLHWFRPAPSAGVHLVFDNRTELLFAAVAIVGIAPIVEERFFRGWLQPALASSLGRHSGWAPLLTGLAFAAAHPAYSFLPVLVLGLLNGLLMQRFRSLSACMVAHAIHNAFALYLGS